MSNLINAVINVINNPILEIKTHYSNKNRANNAGDALEEFIKDLFADSFDSAPEDRNKRWIEIFSYLGNNNNPPDIILKGGDAIEVKKIESKDASLALNSSYPKHTLRRDDPMISSFCRGCENENENKDWYEKDIIYAVGVVEDNKLNSLCMVYGTEFCASQECYEKIRQTIKDGVETITAVEFSETKELGRVNKVDPLGITYLRIRGMWGIENPWKVFKDIYERDFSREFNFMCLISDKKWESFDNKEDLEKLIKEKADTVSKRDVEVKNPDNPAQPIKAKLISFMI